MKCVFILYIMYISFTLTYVNIDNVNFPVHTYICLLPIHNSNKLTGGATTAVGHTMLCITVLTLKS